MPELTSSPVTINISKSDKSETSVKFKAGKKNVFKHYKSDPEDKTKLVCNYCGESVKSSSRKIHYKYWHSGYREKMGIQKDTPYFNGKIDFPYFKSKHFKKTIEGNFKCTYCGENIVVPNNIRNNVARLKQFKLHIYQNHPEKLTEAQLASIQEMESKKNIHRTVFAYDHFIVSENGFQCKYCEVTLKSSSGCKAHMYPKHKDQLSELEKKTCEKQVLNRKNKDKLRYKRRPKIIDPSTGELVKERLRHFCSYPGCGKGFTAPSKLELHIPSHTGEKNHQCTVCGNRYPRNKSLDKHMIS